MAAFIIRFEREYYFIDLLLQYKMQISENIQKSQNVCVMAVSKFRQVMKYLAGFSFQFLIVSHFDRTGKKMKVTFSLTTKFTPSDLL